MDECLSSELDELVVSMLIWLAAVLTLFSQVLELSNSDLLHGLEDLGQLLDLIISWIVVSEVS